MNKIIGIITIVTLLMVSSGVYAIDPIPTLPTIDNIILIANLEYLADDNHTNCQITAIPVDAQGNEVAGIVWFSSSLPGTYLNGASHPPGMELPVVALAGGAIVNLTSNITTDDDDEPVGFEPFILGNTAITAKCVAIAQIVILIVNGSWPYPPPHPANNPPLISNPTPSNGATDVSPSLSSLSVMITDADGDLFSWTIQTSPNVGSTSGSGDSNGTKTCSIGGLVYGITYTWYVNATDTDSGLTTHAVYTFTTEIPSFTFQLKAGWNLICLPLDTMYLTAEDIGLSIPGCDSIARWNIATQGWVTHPIGGPFNFNLVDGVSYFVHVTGNVAYTIQASSFSSVSVGLSSGYNTIGWVSSTGTTAEWVATHITSCNTVSMWNVMTQTWVSHPISGPFNFNVLQGMGLMVSVTAPGTWNPPV